MSKYAAVIVLFLSLVFEANANAFVHPITRILCNDPEYTCIRVQRGDTWYSLFPDDYARAKVMRVNRMNTYLAPGLIIAVPNNLSSVDLMDLSPFSRRIQPPGQKVLIFDPSTNAWGAYNPDGTLERWGPASGGRGYCADIHGRCNTPRGEFSIYSKQGEGCISTKFPVGKGGAPMPYCMFFKGGFAFHGSPEVPGYNASHGCVRVFYEDARWLNLDFIDLPNASNGYRGTKVIIQNLH